jgi:hypothetical protein
MTPAVYLALVQAAIIVVLAMDRWVHRVTGKASLEARVLNLEQRMDKASKMLSEEFGSIQIGVIRIEEHIKATDQRIVDLKERVDRFHGAA